MIHPNQSLQNNECPKQSASLCRAFDSLQNQGMKMIGQQHNTHLAVGLAAAAAVVAGSPLAASVAAGSVELAEQVPVIAVTGWAWQMSAAAAAAVELVAVAEDRYDIKPPKKAIFSLRQLQRKLHTQASKVTNH